MNIILMIAIVASVVLLVGWLLIPIAIKMLDGEDEDGWNDRR